MLSFRRRKTFDPTLDNKLTLFKYKKDESVMKSTEELMKQLENISIEEFKNTDLFDQTSISDTLNELLTQRGLSARDIIINLNMERSYTYQILSGRRNPTRNFLIRFGLYLNLSLNQIQKLLSIGKRSVLYPRNRFDAAVIYAILHHMSIEELNMLLEQIDEPPLT